MSRPTVSIGGQVVGEPESFEYSNELQPDGPHCDNSSGAGASVYSRTIYAYPGNRHQRRAAAAIHRRELRRARKSRPR